MAEYPAKVSCVSLLAGEKMVRPSQVKTQKSFLEKNHENRIDCVKESWKIKSCFGTPNVKLDDSSKSSYGLETGLLLIPKLVDTGKAKRRILETILHLFCGMGKFQSSTGLSKAAN